MSTALDEDTLVLVDEALPDDQGVGLVDVDGRIVALGRGAVALLEVPGSERGPVMLGEVVPSAGDLVETAQADGACTRELSVPSSSGADRRLVLTLKRPRPTSGYLTLHVRDRTQAWAQSQQLSRQALSDALTGLANRPAFELRASQILRRRRTPASPGLLIAADLDRFKAVNDRFGHRAGDEVLQEIARRLLARVRDGDVVARFGGDEFVMLIDGHESAERAAVVCSRLIEAIAQPIRTRDAVVTVGVSMGAVVLPCDASDGELADLVELADHAAYRAKLDGGGVALVPADDLTAAGHAAW